MSTFSLDSFVRNFNSKIERPVQDHLKQVYGCLAMSTMVASMGAYIHMYTELLSGGIVSALVGLGFLLALLATPDENGKNRNTRLGYLMAFSFCTGLGLGPLLDIVNVVNSSIIGTAFFGTSLIFGCFSISALLAPRGRWIYLGGPLLSLLSTMSIMALANLFFRSQLMFQAHLYIGFAVMCAFILYDTQMIVEKRRLGDTDYITHSLDLFIDFVSVFRHLLVILTQKEQKKSRR